MRLTVGVWVWVGARVRVEVWLGPGLVLGLGPTWSCEWASARASRASRMRAALTGTPGDGLG